MTRAVEVRVSGEVQGVSFRAYAVQEAIRLELGGWVRNERDGTVAGHFEGRAETVEMMLAWCREGSPAAVVSQIDVREVAPLGTSDFRVRH